MLQLEPHLHLQLLGGRGLQLVGNGALQSVPHQSQTLAAVVGNGQDLTLHGLPVHPITLQSQTAGMLGHLQSASELKAPSLCPNKVNVRSND